MATVFGLWSAQRLLPPLLAILLVFFVPKTSAEDQNNVRSSNEDATGLLPGLEYKWSQWTTIRFNDSLFLARGKDDDVVIRLFFDSMGSFIFKLNGKYYSMHISGGTDELLVETQSIAKNDLERARESTKKDVPPQPLAMEHYEIYGPWRLFWSDFMKKELLIKHEKWESVITLRKDLPGFIYKTNQGDILTITNDEDDRQSKDSSQTYNVITKKKLKKGNYVIKVSIAKLDDGELEEAQYVVDKDSDEVLSAAKQLFGKMEQVII